MFSSILFFAAYEAYVAVKVAAVVVIAAAVARGDDD